MKIFLTDQQKVLDIHLARLKHAAVMLYDTSRLAEKNTLIHINATRRLEQVDASFLFNYRIFPSNILTYKTQWEAEERSMQVGDTIVQQVYLPPFPRFSQKIIFGVRVNEIIDEPLRKGFSYETLEGHVEKGVSTFLLEQQADGLLFRIHTFSAPGNFLANLLSPVFSRPYQAYCTRAALKNVKRQLEAHIQLLAKV